MSNLTVWQNNFCPMTPANENSNMVISDLKSDIQLINLTLEGDKLAFEEIFERYKRLVAVIARRYFQQPDQIEEVIQITFAKAYQDLRKFRGKHDFSMTSWLGRITTNTCFDILKDQKKRPAILQCDLSNDEREILFVDRKNIENGSEKNLIERDLAEKLLSNLPESDRALLQMLHAEEMSISEISKITGWSNSKIKVRAYRARILLQKILRKFL